METLVCLWCGKKYIGDRLDYPFCDRCIVNLQKIEAMIDDIKFTEKVEKLLSNR